MPQIPNARNPAGKSSAFGETDLWIAATTPLAHGALLVTNNTGEFSRLKTGCYPEARDQARELSLRR